MRFIVIGFVVFFLFFTPGHCCLCSLLKSSLFSKPPPHTHTKGKPPLMISPQHLHSQIRITLQWRTLSVQIDRSWLEAAHTESSGPAANVLRKCVCVWLPEL